MSYMTISSQENHHFSLCSYFHAHPTILLLKILGDQCMGRPPTSNFGGRPSPSPPRSPPLPAPNSAAPPIVHTPQQQMTKSSPLLPLQPLPRVLWPRPQRSAFHHL